MVLSDLDEAERKRLRLGMSANLDVIAYHNPSALLVPVRAVAVRNNKSWVKVKDKESLRVREVEVVTGVTTVSAVEIVSGLKANAEVVLPGM